MGRRGLMKTGMLYPIVVLHVLQILRVAMPIAVIHAICQGFTSNFLVQRVYIMSQRMLMPTSRKHENIIIAQQSKRLRSLVMQVLVVCS